MAFLGIGTLAALGVAVPTTFSGIGLMERRPRLGFALFSGGLAVIVAFDCVLMGMLL